MPLGGTGCNLQNRMFKINEKYCFRDLLPFAVVFGFP